MVKFPSTPPPGGIIVGMCVAPVPDPPDPGIVCMGGAPGRSPRTAVQESSHWMQLDEFRYWDTLGYPEPTFSKFTKR